MNESGARNARLLLVDDDKSLLRLLTIRLEGEGYQVTAVMVRRHYAKFVVMTTTWCCQIYVCPALMV